MIEDSTINRLFKRKPNFKYDEQNFDNFKYLLSHFLTKLLLTVDFSHTKYYKIDVNEDGKLGIFVDYDGSGNYKWSWMNSINTNYSGWALIINRCNFDFGCNFTNSDFYGSDEKVKKNILKLFEVLEKNKQDFFSPKSEKSEVFKELFFKLQTSWLSGLTSSLISLKYITQKYKLVKGSFASERGSSDDFNGIDFSVYDEDNEILNVQHKKCSDLYVYNNYLKSKTIIYDKGTYKKNVNLLTIDNGEYVYIFKNSTDNSLIGVDQITKEFFVEDSLLLHKIKKMEDIHYKKLIKITEICCIKIKFALDVYTSETDTENSYTLEPKKRLLTIKLSNLLDESGLLNMFDEIVEKLNNLPK